MTLPITRNGRSCSWGHISVVVPGSNYRMSGFTDISYDDTNDESKEGGLGVNRANRRSIGEYTANDAKFTGFQSDVSDLLQALAGQGSVGATGLRSVNPVIFDVQVAFSHTDSDPPALHVLQGCRVKAVGNSYTFGPDLLKQDLTLSLMSIIRDGVVLYDLSTEAVF